MPTLSCCVIAKNEEENIRRWFESIDGCFDAIHFVDTGSTDNTVEIAKSLGMTVHHFNWINDFAAARNFAFSKATTDYIFWNDLDDVLENKEEFIKWKNTIMGLADMWLATYHYSLDEQGKPACSFARERVIKNNIGIHWKYFVHEGLIPDGKRQIAANYATTWAIKHMRTQQDLDKDRSRNLNLIEKNKDHLDPRMTYYYGKELFENGKEFDAINPLVTAMKDKSLEIHDRVLATQYCCYAMMKCNQFEKAISIAHTGIEIQPQRAEFHSIIGDCYIKLNRPLDAALFYRSAKECIKQGDSQRQSAIFSTESQYTTYPSNQLSKIYANTNRLEEAYEESKYCMEKFKDKEAEAINTEILRLKNICVGYKEAVQCDDIVISCPPHAPYKWDAEIYKTSAMGGSETAAIEMSRWLHKLSGRPVKIFNVRDDDLVCDGVEYYSTNKLNEYMSKHKPWLHISWRHNFKITDAPTFAWNHDLVTPGIEIVGNYNKAMALTQFHKDYLHMTQGVPYEKIWVTRNGIVPERFRDIPLDKDPFKFVFSSSPDRGLEQCMRVLDKVREKYPQVTLSVFYGIEHLDKYGLKDMRIKLEKMLEERKAWVTYYGKTEQNELMRHFKGAAYNVQPSSWIETSCISALELVLCGIYPIFRKVGGVADTLKEASSLGMASLVDSDCITEAEYQIYIDETIKALDEERYKRVKIDAEPLSWENVCKEWLRDLPVFAYGDK